MKTDGVRDKKCLVVITGASRGFGKAIAETAANTLASDSAFLLLARNEDALNQTKSAMKWSGPVVTRAVDLAKADANEYKKLLSEFVKEVDDVSSYESCLLVHNVGSIGDQGRAVRDMDDMASMMDFYALNLFSPLALNSVFLKMFEQGNVIVVNVSSLWAIRPSAHFGQYCSVKAAKESIFNVLVQEEANKPNFALLHYAPGAMKTDIWERDIMQSERTPQSVREFHAQLVKEERMIDPFVSAQKMWTVLANGFESGARIDYYDIQ